MVFSVHQPSPRAFRAADKVLLLAPGGRAPGAARRGPARLVPRRGRGLPRASGSNPGDRTGTAWTYPVDAQVATRALRSSSARARERRGGFPTRTPLRVAQAAALVSPAEGAADVTPRTTTGIAIDDTESIPARDERYAKRNAVQKVVPWRSFATELRVLTRRAFLTLARDPSLAVAHLAVGVGASALLGCLYLDSPMNLAGFQNRAGGMFFTWCSSGSRP